MRGAGRLLMLAALGMGLAPLGSTLNVAAAPAWHTWVGAGTGVFRDGTYDRGEYIYSNGIFQSLGANADHLHRRDYYALAGESLPTYSPNNDLYNALTYDFFGAHRSTHNGDFQLPTDRTKWPDYTADMAELRLAIDGGNLYVRAQFTSFPKPDAQVATLAFAPAAAPGAAHAWPLNAGVKSPWSLALTMWGTGAQLDSGGGSQPLVAAGGAFRTTDHAFEARIPLVALPPGPWSLTGGSGLDDPSSPGHYWAVPSGGATTTQPGAGAPLAPGANVWDLLFSRDPTWTFDELKQADDLLAGDVSSDSQLVTPALLAAGATQPSGARPGDISRWFTSAIGGADGIDRSAGLVPFSPPSLPSELGLAPAQDFDITYHYPGRLQPYYMHIPGGYPTRSGPMPLIVYLHGFTGLPDEPFYNPIGLVDAADRNGYLLASALGRGDYSYRGPGDIDVKEVIADVEKHYQVDPNRIYLMGHSMGGYGTNNVGIHNPDLFAAIAPAEGTDSIDLHQNLRNLAWLEMTGEQDLDTFGTQAKKLYADLSTDGYDATLVDYQFKIHEYSSIYDTLDRLFAFFAGHRRNPNPPVVSYSRLPGDDVPAIGLVYDHAYWLSGLRNADTTKRSDIQVESMGISHGALNPTAATRTVSAKTDTEAGGKTGPLRTQRQLFQTVPAYLPAHPVTNAASVTATNISGMTLDLARMGLRDDCTLTLNVRADHALAINLGNRLVSAPAGTSVQTVGSGVCGAATTAGGGTPNTGARGATLALALALLAVAVIAATTFGRNHLPT